MARFVEFDVADGETQIIVEMADDTPRGPVRATRGGAMVEKASVALEDVASRIRPLAEIMLSQLKTLPSKPTEIDIEFGVKLNASAGVVIAQACSEGHVKIALRWKS